MRNIIVSNKNLVFFIVALLASVGFAISVMQILKKWTELEFEAREKGKQIEYIAVIISIISLLLAFASFFYTNTKYDALNKKIIELEKIDEAEQRK